MLQTKLYSFLGLKHQFILFKMPNHFCHIFNLWKDLLLNRDKQNFDIFHFIIKNFLVCVKLKQIHSSKIILSNIIILF